MFFKVLLSFETVFHAQSRQNIKFLVEEGNKCKRHFFTSFSSVPWPYIVYIIIAYKQKCKRENKYYLKTFQIDPLLMFLFLCVKDNLPNFPFKLNAMLVHGNCHHRMPINFEGHILFMNKLLQLIVYGG